MKNKKYIIIGFLIVTIILFVIGLFNSSLPEFVDKRFYREIPGCGENLGFASNNKMYYYEDCGNPVDDFDLCEDYKYYEDKKEIIVYCDGFEEHFKVIKYIPGGQLTLERNNETLIFEEESN